MSRLRTSCITVSALALAIGLAGCSIVRDPGSIARETRRDPSTLAAYLSEAQGLPVHDGGVKLELPIRIGLTFLPPAGYISDAVPTTEQRVTAAVEVRDVMLALPYVSEVIIITGTVLDPDPTGGFEKLRELSQRFDFDLLVVLSSDQTSYETQNLRSLGLITVIGADLWEGDVDRAVTVIDFALVEPSTRTVVMSAASAAAFGDTTSLLDDWRSNRHVRRVSFDEARVALIKELPKKLDELRSRLEPPSVQRP